MATSSTRIAHGLGGLRIFNLEPRAHRRGRGLEQLEEAHARQIVAATQRERELGIATGTHGQLAVAGERETGTAIAHDLVDDAAVAALDQHVRDRLAQLQPLGDGHQMRLALGGRILHKIGFGELRRMRQHRSGHLDGIVEGERADDLGRRVLRAGKAARELGARFDLDIDGEPLQHVVEYGDLLARIAARSGREQIGDAQQDPQTTLHIAGGDGLVQFIEQRGRSGERRNIAGMGNFGHWVRTGTDMLNARPPC